MRRYLEYGLLLLLLLAGCGNEVDLIAPHEDIPSLFCVLNQNDSSHYVRLERSFAGPKNAYEMALEHDSIYYPSAEVWLEAWKNNSLLTSYIFEETDSVPKDSGIFHFNSPQMFVATGSLDPSAEYLLKARIPQSGKELESRTRLVDGLRVIKPEYTRPSINFSAYNNYLEIEWISTTAARIYFLELRFNYLNVTGRDTTLEQVKWPIAHYVSSSAVGGERMESAVFHQNFYKFVSTHIPKPSSGQKRIALKKAIDILFTIGGEELYTYMQVYDPDHGSMSEKPVYSNITNGIGIFSSRYQKEVTGKALTYPSIDSLAYGQFTKELGFVDSTDDYYSR